jgi:ketosteroid isomerase-like protein
MKEMAMAKNEEEEAVRIAVVAFYRALDHLLCNRGTDEMERIWHHEDCVSTVHPFGHWAKGWDEVWACWQESAAVFSYYRGHVGLTEGIGTIHDPKITVVGDMAFVIGVYKSLMHFPDRTRPLSVNCTEVLIKRGGVWKMAHHHADQANDDYQKALARMVEQ